MPLGQPASNLQANRLHASPAQRELVIWVDGTIQIVNACIADQLPMIPSALAIDRVSYFHGLAEYLKHIILQTLVGVRRIERRLPG
jgi:hypothetical protein